MIETVLNIDLTASVPAMVGSEPLADIPVKDLDDLYYRYVTEDGTAPTTGVLTMYTKRTVSEPPYAKATLTLDGTDQKIDIDGEAYINFATTTTESGRTGKLYIFARRAQE